MKGYVVHSGYMGYIDGKYRLFATEEEYMEIYREEEDESIQYTMQG